MVDKVNKSDIKYTTLTNEMEKIMRVLNRVYCRVFQNCFKIAIPFLPYRTPKILKSTSQISYVCMENQISRVMIVTDSVIHQLGILERMCEHLDHHSIKYTIYDKTVQNPTSENVEEAKEIYIKNQCQALIGFGGGSSMDCAKAIGARLARPHKTLSQMEGILKVWKKIPLLICVPTTAGTGSETTLAAVIVDSKTRHKYAINDFYLIPDYAVLDPKPTLSLPAFTTACTGMDALTHAVEAYIGNSTTKKTRQYALNATKLIFENIYTVYENGKDVQARSAMLDAAYYAGHAFTVSYVGYVHAIAHSLGGKYNVAHGLANAILLDVILEMYGSSVYKKLYEMALYCGICDVNDSYKIGAERFIHKIKQMKKTFGIPDTFKSLKQEDISELAAYANQEANPLYPVPVLWDAKDLEKVYYKVMEDRE